MTPRRLECAMTLMLLGSLVLATPAAGQARAVLDELNGRSVVKSSDDLKSYTVLFDACLKMTDPPMEVGPDFNLTTIHPGMDEWTRVAAWAEENGHMAAAIREAGTKTVLGLPYGAMNVKSEYREAGLVADVASGGNLWENEFPYLDALDMIAAFVAAESYRLLEAGETEPASDLAMLHLYVVRQYCDREFLEEKTRSIGLLSDSLSVLRDQMYSYLETYPVEALASLGWVDVPFLKVGRNQLFMPEGDRIVAAALIRDVIDESAGPDVQKFTEMFARVQSARTPLTRFGAAKRWGLIAEWHDSLEASIGRLNLIYDDWWRRWRVQEYDPILDIDSEFKKTNTVRYAAVVYTVQDLGDLFAVRNRLIAEVNGTAMAAGFAAYRRTFDAYPAGQEKLYGQFIRKFTSDRDPFDKQFAPMKYRTLDSRTAVDTAYGRVWIEAGDSCILYSRGQNHEDDRGVEHTEDGLTGDIVFWPPIRVLAREQGLLD